jgi:aspartate/methionine/tyrosine aminotransferase
MSTLAQDYNYLCAAVSRLGSEAAFEVLGRARALQAAGRDIVHLEVGEPDFDTPAHVKAAGKAAIDANFTHYAPNPGIMDLREAVAEYATRFRALKTPYAAENVVVAPGAKPIIWNLLSALLDPGDEMLYADPAYPTYAAAAGYLGARAVPVRLLESKNWRLDLDELAARVSPRTKILVLNSPHNPTGGVLTRDDLAAIAAIASKHRFLILTDEIYSRNIYGARFESITQFEELRDRTIVVDGFSKAYAMTGWRLGYCLAPPKIARAATLLANNTYACVATFVQKAGIAALHGPDAPVVEMNEIFRTRRDAVIAGLNAIPNVSACVPDGAFYAFPNISRITPDDKRLASYLLEEAGVALLGGSCFGEAGAGYLRISYANSIENLEQALERMRAALPKYASWTGA